MGCCRFHRHLVKVEKELEVRAAAHVAGVSAYLLRQVHLRLARCRTWVYLSRLVGTDLTEDTYVSINYGGSVYDDDVGGPV